MKDAEIDVLFEENAAREEENRIVSPRRLERIEDLNSMAEATQSASNQKMVSLADPDAAGGRA